jgi:hypothetical protein
MYFLNFNLIFFTGLFESFSLTYFFNRGEREGDSEPGSQGRSRTLRLNRYLNIYEFHCIFINNFEFNLFLLNDSFMY